MKRFAVALALMCALSASTFAGNMPTGGKAEEPPLPGNMPTTGAASSSPSNATDIQVLTSSTQSSVITTVILTIIDLTT